jgi:condensin complex subunit 2
MTDFDNSIQIVVGPETDDDMPEPSRAMAGRFRPPRPSAVPRKSLLSHHGAGSQRLRRRSSARFLSIGGRRGGAAEEDAESLGKMYKQAIRMNAENRINASNSWNFNLIDNIDKFLTDLPEEEEEESSFSDNHAPMNEEAAAAGSQTRRVNFTKASCTLDASVKIYSYRVDDVHLTSYKVLENLHRTDGDKKKKSKDNSDETGDEASEATRANQRAKSPTATVESNLGTCCMVVRTLTMQSALVH